MRVPWHSFGRCSMLGACTGGSQTHSRLRRGLPFSCSFDSRAFQTRTRGILPLPCSFDWRAFQHRAQRSYSWCSISLGEALPDLSTQNTLTSGHRGHPASSPRSVTLFRLSMLLFNWWTWRGSNPVPSLIPCNLLILRNGRNAKNGQNASLTYTAGTRTAARVLWEYFASFAS